MKIRVAFTLDVERDSLEALKKFTDPIDGADMTDVRLFLTDEAAEHLEEYLLSNGIKVKLV